MKKIDDVTDCFLQAAAWVAWEGNRVEILESEWDVQMSCLKGGEEGSVSEVEVKNKKPSSARRKSAVKKEAEISPKDGKTTKKATRSTKK